MGLGLMFCGVRIGLYFTTHIGSMSGPDLMSARGLQSLEVFTPPAACGSLVAAPRVALVDPAGAAVPRGLGLKPRKPGEDQGERRKSTEQCVICCFLFFSASRVVEFVCMPSDVRFLLATIVWCALLCCYAGPKQQGNRDLDTWFRRRSRG